MYHVEARSDWYDEERIVEGYNAIIFKAFRRQRRTNKKYASWDYLYGNPDEKLNYREWYEHEGDEGWEDIPGGEIYTFGWWADTDSAGDWDIRVPPLTITLGEIKFDDPKPTHSNPLNSQGTSNEQGESVTDGNATEHLHDEPVLGSSTVRLFGSSEGKNPKNTTIDEVIESGVSYVKGQEVPKSWVTNPSHTLIGYDPSLWSDPNVVPVISKIVVNDRVKYNTDKTGVIITYAEYLVLLDAIYKTDKSESNE